MIDLACTKAFLSCVMGEYEQAGHYIREAVRLSSNNDIFYDVCVFCGRLSQAIGDSESALSHYNAALSSVLKRLNTAKSYLNESRVRDRA